jgi:crotonobetainyl-CoA:carnitine CoA-transferase CaiB-like acyl-CoA transferase
VAHWVDQLNEAGVPAGPVYTVPQVFEDPQVKHLRVTETLPTSFGKDVHFITQPVALSRTPSKVVAPAPGWGEHTDEVLHDLGYNASAIEGLRARGVV